MSDLISKSETIDLLYQVFEKHSMATDKNDPLCGFGAELFKNIKAMPTAFDADKVVAQLERDKFIESETTLSDVHQGYNAGLNRAIEIVKQGGKEQ